MYACKKPIMYIYFHTHLQHSDGILDSGSEALTSAFNRRGTLLAVGCNDGRIAVWDFMTRGIARMLNGHIHPITSLRFRSCLCIYIAPIKWAVNTHCVVERLYSLCNYVQCIMYGPPSAGTEVVTNY